MHYLKFDFRSSFTTEKRKQNGILIFHSKRNFIQMKKWRFIFNIEKWISLNVGEQTYRYAYM